MARHAVLWPVLIVVLSVGGVALAPQSVTGSMDDVQDPWDAIANSTQVHDLTTEPAHTTEPHRNVTTQPTNHTTEHTNVTTQPTNHTTEHANVTTQPANHTTEHPTTHPNNVTTPDHGGNGTTAEGPTTHHTGTSPPAPTTTTTTTTEKPAGSKFDVASFFGGMAAAVGITVLIFVIVRCYSLRRKTRYNAM